MRDGKQQRAFQARTERRHNGCQDTRGMTSNRGARRIFLLSPANMDGLRAQLLLSDRAEFDLAKRLRNGGAPLGEVFSFVSGLYFRGKLAYAEAFAESCPGVSGVLVITSCGGLIPPDRPITPEQLQTFSATDLDPSDCRYRGPLVRDCRVLSAACPGIMTVADIKGDVGATRGGSRVYHPQPPPKTGEEVVHDA